MATEPVGPDPATPPAATTASGSMFYNLGRGAKLVALLFFFLPWVTVSCAGQELVSMSGYDLAMGSVSVTNPMTGASETPPGAGERDLPVIAAAALILLALGATFVLARGTGTLVGAGGALLAALLISYTVFVRLPGKMREGPAGGAGADASAMGMNEQQLAEMIQVNHATGFWLTLLALAAAIALNLMARRSP